MILKIFLIRLNKLLKKNHWKDSHNFFIKKINSKSNTSNRNELILKNNSVNL
jgi:hypothetical protein